MMKKEFASLSGSERAEDTVGFDMSKLRGRFLRDKNKNNIDCNP